MYTNMVFGIAKSVLFIEVSSFQGVQIREFHYVPAKTDKLVFTCNEMINWFLPVKPDKLVTKASLHMNL